MLSEQPPRLSESELAQAAPWRVDWREALLGVGLLAAPSAWFAHLTLSYGLIYPAFDWQSKAALHAVSLVAALVALFTAAVGWHGLRRSRLGALRDAAQRERVHFLSAMACGSGLFFLLAVLAQSIPAVMLSLGGRP